MEEAETANMEHTHTRIDRHDHNTVVCMHDKIKLKAREKYGTVYLPNTLHHLVAGLMHHLRQSGKVLHIFRDAKFSEFHASLDAEMECLQSEGMGSRKRKNTEPPLHCSAL